MRAASLAIVDWLGLDEASNERLVGELKLERLNGLLIENRAAEARTHLLYISNFVHHSHSMTIRIVGQTTLFCPGSHSIWATSGAMPTRTAHLYATDAGLVMAL